MYNRMDADFGIARAPNTHTHTLTAHLLANKTSKQINNERDRKKAPSHSENWMKSRKKGEEKID